MIRLTTSSALGLALASCALVLQAQAQTPGQTTGQTPGQKTEQPTGQTTRQTPGQTTAQTPARPSGKTLAASAGLMVYPAKGQRANQQAQDEAQCFEWARDQTGYDPVNPPPPPSAHTSEGPSSQADGDLAPRCLGRRCRRRCCRRSDRGHCRACGQGGRNWRDRRLIRRGDARATTGAGPSPGDSGAAAGGPTGARQCFQAGHVRMPGSAGLCGEVAERQWTARAARAAARSENRLSSWVPGSTDACTRRLNQADAVRAVCADQTVSDSRTSPSRRRASGPTRRPTT
ncbi:MAG: hypothetical protein JWO52_7921 [Gammaproteobacteria bacterium]|jgi:hypothetical protein|nr:hypothetical protein [Gammaproteobacteria bacterium]